MKSLPHAVRVRGRPREFDIDKALDQATQVFRERGYNATSIGDLISAMGVASGSIYKAFQDKRAVFRAAFDRYMSLRNDQLGHVARTDKPARERLRDVLIFYVESSKGIEGRRGSLRVGSAAQLASVDRQVPARVSASLASTEAFVAALS